MQAKQVLFTISRPKNRGDRPGTTSTKDPPSLNIHVPMQFGNMSLFGVKKVPHTV